MLATSSHSFLFCVRGRGFGSSKGNILEKLIPCYVQDVSVGAKHSKERSGAQILHSCGESVNLAQLNTLAGEGPCKGNLGRQTKLAIQ